MRKGLFAKKSVQSLLKLTESEAKHGGLRKTLGPVQLTAWGIGAIIGAGIFVYTGQAAAIYAGPAVIFSFIFAGLIALFAALCYAEMAALVPVSGSAYTYAYVCFGEFPAWILGWVMLMNYIGVTTAVAAGWSGYFASFLQTLGIKLSSAFSKGPFAYDTINGWTTTGNYVDIPAMCIVAFFGILVSLGIRLAASANSIMVVVKLAVIILFICFGVSFINTDQWFPIIPENTGVFGQFGWSGIFRAAGVVFFAYNGFDSVSTLAQECRNPQKDIPKGLLGSLGLSTVFYLIMALVLTGIASYTLLNVPDPISVAVNMMGPSWKWLHMVVNVGILVGLSSVILVQILSTSRILYTISHDKLLPSKFGKLHPKFRTPFFGTMIVTLISMIISGLFPVGALGLLVSIGILIVFGSVCFGVLILRYTNKSINRPFKCPLFPWIPLAGTLLCLMQMLLMPLATWIELGVWVIMGCLVYFLYSKKRSPLQK